MIRRNPVTTRLYSCPDAVTANILSEQEIEDYLIEAEKQGRLPMFHLLMNTGVKVGELIQASAGHTTAAMTLKHYIKNRNEVVRSASVIDRAYSVKQ